MLRKLKIVVGFLALGTIVVLGMWQDVQQRVMVYEIHQRTCAPSPEPSPSPAPDPPPGFMWAPKTKLGEPSPLVSVTSTVAIVTSTVAIWPLPGTVEGECWRCGRSIIHAGNERVMVHEAEPDTIIGACVWSGCYGCMTDALKRDDGKRDRK